MKEKRIKVMYDPETGMYYDGHWEYKTLEALFKAQISREDRVESLGDYIKEKMSRKRKVVLPSVRYDERVELKYYTEYTYYYYPFYWETPGNEGYYKETRIIGPNEATPEFHSPKAKSVYIATICIDCKVRTLIAPRTGKDWRKYARRQFRWNSSEWLKNNPWRA